MTRMALPTPTLHTARLRLRPFDDADADGLFALHSDARVLRYWDAPPWGEPGRAGRFITACRRPVRPLSFRTVQPGACRGGRQRSQMSIVDRGR